MKAIRTLAVAASAAAVTMAGMSTASAVQAGPMTCPGGAISSGTYSSLTVTGKCYLPDGAHVVVTGNVTIAPYAALDSTVYSTSSLNIRGNVTAGRGASVAIGCTPQAHPCGDGSGKPGVDSVGGNVVLNQVFNAAFNGMSIGGNLVSSGGGAGLIPSPFIPFSVKDDTIRGNVVVTGLRTVWFGVVRSTIGGNVVLTNNAGSDPDTNEVITNRIGGNLVCIGNNPPSQYGDAIENPMNGPNVVRGQAIGQCAPLTRVNE